jgi:PPIC-type PPIASE domain
VRRLVTLFVLALAGAVWAGASFGGAAVASSAATLSRADFARELIALEATPAGCYIAQADHITITVGAGANTVSRAAVTSWANYRLAGLGLIADVERSRPHPFTAANLRAGRAKLLATWTNAAQGSCGATTAATALAALGEATATSLVRAETASMMVSAAITGTVPLTTAGLQSFYQAHPANYSKTCASVILLPPPSLSSFEAAARSGVSFAQLAHQFSADTSAANGGAIGCFDPTTTAMTYFAALPLNAISAPRPITFSGQNYYLFGTATSRTLVPFAQVASVVLRDAESFNQGLASAWKDGILLHQGVRVDPALGVFARVGSSFGIVAPPSPGLSATPNGAATLG